MPIPGFAALGGIAYLIAAVFCFAGLDTTTKVLALSAPVAIWLWFRYLLQTLVSSASLFPRAGRRILRTQRPGLQFLRGLMLTLCSLFAFFSLRHMPVGEFTAIIMFTPLLMTVLATRLLEERVSLLRWICLLGGFSGALIVIRPGGGLFDWTLLFPIAAVLANTAYQIITSQLAATDSPSSMQFYTGLTGLMLSTLVMPFYWQALPLNTWLLMLLAGSLSTLGHFLLIYAYQRANVSTLTPFLYLQIGFASLGGWVVFGHVPDRYAVGGILLLALSGVLGTWLAARERRRQLRETQVGKGEV